MAETGSIADRDRKVPFEGQAGAKAIVFAGWGGSLTMQAVRFCGRNYLSRLDGRLALIRCGRGTQRIAANRTLFHKFIT